VRLCDEVTNLLVDGGDRYPLEGAHQERHVEIHVHGAGAELHAAFQLDALHREAELGALRVAPHEERLVLGVPLSVLRDRSFGRQLCLAVAQVVLNRVLHDGTSQFVSGHIARIGQGTARREASLAGAAPGRVPSVRYHGCA